MRQSTISITIVARTTKKDNSISNLYARLTYNSKRAEFSLNRTIASKLWDTQASRAKGTSTNSRKINNYLTEVQGQLLDTYEALKRERAVISSKLVRAKYLNNESSEMTLLSAFEYHNEEVAHTLAPGTVRHYKICLSHVKRFLKQELKAEDIYLDELSFSFITRFELFLRKYRPANRQNYIGNNSIMKHIQRVRKIVTLTVKLEWIDKDPFAKYKCKFTPSTRKYLSDDDLANFEALSNLDDGLQYAKDLFVFSCYSGLVYIDAMQLTPNHIVIGIDGSKWIYTDRQKSSQAVRIPLLPKAEAIISKWRNNEGLTFIWVGGRKPNYNPAVRD